MAHRETTTAVPRGEANHYSIINSFRDLCDQLISDQDTKFISRIWKSLFHTTKVQLVFTAAHYAAAHGQAELTDQTFIHALRCAISRRYDHFNWEDLLPEI